MDDSITVYNIILAIMYFGDVVFAASGAMAAAQKRMDVVGYVVVGVVTGIGGGTLRDLLLNRPAWWTHEPLELLLCVGAALAVYVLDLKHPRQGKGLAWFDCLGLSAFTVVGTYLSLAKGAHPLVAVFLAVITATGGGVMRDLLTGRTPMILRGQLYALAVLAGSGTYLALHKLNAPLSLAAMAGFFTTFTIRSLAIHYSITLGPPRNFLSWKRPGSDDQN